VPREAGGDGHLGVVRVRGDDEVLVGVLVYMQVLAATSSPSMAGTCRPR
jgi:hypothetical protein